ncbi:MAG: riboflavin synthase [Vicinamibacterales bacterium]
MFTGLIETVGRVSGLKAMAAGLELRVRTELAADLLPGDSLAVNGVCLTATVARDGEVHADVGPETVRITTLGALQLGQPVNLERPMRSDGRFGGHFVQGHVDATGRIEKIRDDGDSQWVTIGLHPSLAPYVIQKGSIAVDGISLTVAELGHSQFDVMVVPFTWTHTNLATLHVGDRVNLEADMVGKYVARAAELAIRTT